MLSIPNSKTDNSTTAHPSTVLARSRSVNYSFWYRVGKRVIYTFIIGNKMHYPANSLTSLNKALLILSDC